MKDLLYELLIVIKVGNTHARFQQQGALMCC